MAGKKVLLVDDESGFLDIMQERIKSWGYQVISVSDPRQAESVFKNYGPDFVILDYIMPQMDGLAVLKQLRAIDKSVPVVMFTAHPDLKSIKGAEHLGVSAFIPKLSTYTDVQAALKSTLAMLERKSLGSGSSTQ